VEETAFDICSLFLIAFSKLIYIFAFLPSNPWNPELRAKELPWRVWWCYGRKERKEGWFIELLQLCIFENSCSRKHAVFAAFNFKNSFHYGL